MGLFDEKTMRDSARINWTCGRLAAVWRCAPDLRFGQLVMNVLTAYQKETGRDPFYAEEYEPISFFEHWMQKSLQK